MKRIIFTLFIVLAEVGVMVAENNIEPEKPQKGYVPDNETAIKVAEAILTPLFGKSTVEAEKPLKANLKGNVWIVTGTLPEGHDGGIAEVRISKATCEILSVRHGK